MIDVERASAWQALRDFLAQLPRKRPAIAVAMLSLITAFFIVAGALSTTATPVLNSEHVTFVSDPSPRCPGEKPGMCPD